MSEFSGVALLDDQDDSDIHAQDKNDTDENCDEPNEFDGMQFSTRVTSKGRRLGKGKRSSISEDTLEPVAKRTSLRIEEIPKVSGTMAVLPGIDKCFVGARLGAKGLRGALAKAKSTSLAVNSDEMDHFDQHLSQFDPIREEGPKLIQKYLDKMGIKWLSYMGADFNILIIGFGYKKPLMLKFVEDYLNGSKVLTVDGSLKISGGVKAIKVLLDGICIRILKHPNLGSSCLELESYTKLICENLNRLYGRESQDFRKRKFGGYDHSVTEEGLSSTGAPLYDISYMRATEYEDEDDDDNDEDQEHENIMNKGNIFEGGITSGLSIAEPRVGGRKRSAVATSSKSMASSSSASTGPACPTWGGRYSHIQGRLYIIVFDLDGECLQSSESQSCMSLLAACSSVSIIANVESVNAPLLWSPQINTNYNWWNNHMPTYQSYPFNASESATMSEKSKDFRGGMKALNAILRCLTERHSQLINLMTFDALKHYDSDPENLSGVDGSTGKYPGINVDELLEITTGKLIARNMGELDKLLHELISHKIIRRVMDSSRKNMVALTLPVSMMRELVKKPN
jgi:hypothetical protein